MLLAICFNLIFFSLPILAHSVPILITWKSTYYNAIPNKRGVTSNYCNQHAPGSFVGNVKDQLTHGTITDRGIRLSHFKPHFEKENGIYIIYGTVLASGKNGAIRW